ncbi:MaoC family dehydratase [Jatrophihabitans cynanchi]|uniref:MaoC family dehydratase n=1 Tax=Jatrophihabitans cynanchi TaxID=2944128 RepID=A0ABY7K529_9ACTN|nr:MaoC family dehydratase [Jatrophihabitans sp. SB3-54]WAX58381.1 MaoC family dehydratase [Jatrophihabitans sp. SB3-54]
MPGPPTDLWRGNYYDELEAGQTFHAGSVTVTDAHLVNTAGLYGDFHPFHVDDVTQASGPFGRRIAHGIFTAGLVIAPIGRIGGRAVATHLEDHVSYLAPVFVGDTIRVVIEVIDKQPKSRFGIVRFRHTGYNQHEVKVVEATTVMGHHFSAPALDHATDRVDPA